MENGGLHTSEEPFRHFALTYHIQHLVYDCRGDITYRSPVDMIIRQTLGTEQQPIDPLHSRIRHIAISHIASDLTQFSTVKRVETCRDGVDVWI